MCKVMAKSQPLACFFEARTGLETSVMCTWDGGVEDETITLFPMLQVMLEGLIYQEI